MAHARPDRKHAALDREAIETGDRIDIDEMRRPRHAERHHRDEALTAGEDAAVLRTEFSEVRQRVIDRLRRVVDERRRFHRARPFGGRERGFAGMLSSHRPPSSTQASRARNKRQRNEVHVRLSGVHWATGATISTPAPARGKDEFFPRLEALRGLAALVVVASHAWRSPWNDPSGGTTTFLYLDRPSTSTADGRRML